MTHCLRRALPLALLAAALASASASAAVTRSSVTSPANPTFRLYESSAKSGKLPVFGTTDGTAGDLVAVVCTRGSESVSLAKAVPVGKDGAFVTSLELGQFKYAPCVLRALPDKYASKDLTAFTGPLVSVSHFDPRASTTGVLDEEGTQVLDYSLATAHRRGVAALSSAAGGGLRDHAGVHPDSLELYNRTWANGAALWSAQLEQDHAPVAVDGRVAYLGASVPRFDYEGDGGRLLAPAGFGGVGATATLDERSGAVTIKETQRAVRCNGTDAGSPEAKDCTSVPDTGVRLERTVTFTEEHGLAGVQDAWTSADGKAHRVRLEYTESAGERVSPLWRFPGDPSFRAYDTPQRVVPNRPGAVLVHDGTKDMQTGALRYDPAPQAFAFASPDRMTEIVEVSVPAGGAAYVERTFALGENVIAADDLEPPVVTLEGPTTTDAPAVTVFGRAVDDVGVTRLTVNGQDVAVGDGGAYTTSVALVPGANRITATATDGAGRSSSVALVVTTPTTSKPEPKKPEPKRCKVPRVRAGATLKSVKSALAKAGCKPGRTARQRSRKVRKGRVLGLSRKAGTTHPAGTKIGIRISSGKR